MPDRNLHCKHTKKMYGITGKDIHEWMDAPVILFGRNQIIMHDHIIMDKKGRELSLKDIKEMRRSPPMTKLNINDDSFNSIWKKISEFQGRIFETVSGTKFVYKIVNGEILTPKSKFPISKFHVKKSLELYPCCGPSNYSNFLSWGSSYLWGILHDEKTLIIINEVLSAQKEPIQTTYEPSIYPETIIEI